MGCSRKHVKKGCFLELILSAAAQLFQVSRQCGWIARDVENVFGLIFQQGLQYLLLAAGTQWIKEGKSLLRIGRFQDFGQCLFGGALDDLASISPCRQVQVGSVSGRSVALDQNPFPEWAVQGDREGADAAVGVN